MRISRGVQELKAYECIAVSGGESSFTVAENNPAMVRKIIMNWLMTVHRAVVHVLA